MHPLAIKLTHALRFEGLAPIVLARRVADNALALARAQITLHSFDRLGSRPRCFGRVCVLNRGKIVAGDDLTLGGRFGTVSLAAEDRASIRMGHGVTINYGAFISAARAITIGDEVMIGPYCVIGDADRGEAGRQIVVGDRVWLAARVVVRPGATIGAGAVIAAGSVVEGEIPANAVASGSPARVLRVQGNDPQNGPTSAVLPWREEAAGGGRRDDAFD